ncbi:Protein of unknown function [Bacillus wiedmannii]|nr:Protein of unknown function [Bacillus wiedmannii]
MGDEQNPID